MSRQISRQMSRQISIQDERVLPVESWGDLQNISLQTTKKG